MPCSWSSSVVIAAGYGLDGRGSIPGRCKISASTASRPAEDHRAPYTMGVLSRGVKRPGREADHCRGHERWSWASTRPCLRGMLLNQLSEGTTLPLCLWLVPKTLHFGNWLFPFSGMGKRYLKGPHYKQLDTRSEVITPLNAYNAARPKRVDMKVSL
jgi:hypothetical protein